MDTTRVAEQQIAGLQISPSTLAAIERQLKHVTISDDDQLFGLIHIRPINGYDVSFIVGREGKTVVVTIGGVIPSEQQKGLADSLEKIGIVAALRGATGV
ncbi:MAG: hypothetical protein AAFU41_08870 [Pseudomonadota bacterium]